MNDIDRYIDQILMRVEVNEQEHHNLKSELTALLNEKKEDYLHNGYTDKIAIEKTINDFGDADEIGMSLSRSISPHRTIALQLLAILSITFTTIAIFKVGIEFNFYPYTWMIIMAILTTLTFIFTKKQIYIARYRMIFMLYCFIYILAWFYGIMLVDGATDHIMTWFYRIIGILFLMIIITNAILGAIYQPVKKHFKSFQTKNRIFIVICNTVSGIIVMYCTLIMLAGFLIFGSAEDMSKLVPPLTLLFIWICSLLISSYRPNLKWLSLCIQIGVCSYIFTIFDFIF